MSEVKTTWVDLTEDEKLSVHETYRINPTSLARWKVNHPASEAILKGTPEVVSGFKCTRVVNNKYGYSDNDVAAPLKPDLREFFQVKHEVEHPTPEETHDDAFVLFSIGKVEVDKEFDINLLVVDEDFNKVSIFGNVQHGIDMIAISELTGSIIPREDLFYVKRDKVVRYIAFHLDNGIVCNQLFSSRDDAEDKVFRLDGWSISRITQEVEGRFLSKNEYNLLEK